MSYKFSSLLTFTKEVTEHPKFEPEWLPEQIKKAAAELVETVTRLHPGATVARGPELKWSVLDDYFTDEEGRDIKSAKVQMWFDGVTP